MRIFYAFILVLLAFLVGCTNSEMSERESKLVGTWAFEVESSGVESRDFKYIELKDDRKGYTGMAVESKGREFLGVVFEITDWRLNGDTLIMEYTMAGGKFSSIGREDTLINDYPVNEYWIIKQRFDSAFVAENYDPAISFSSDRKFVKRQRIERKSTH